MLFLDAGIFQKKNVPAKSRFGNNVTKGVFRFACGIKISDTQTGLRAIPAKYLDFMSRIKGERFEYETRVLLEMKRHHIDFIEQKIETVYIEENASTHFRPVKDSIIIYGVILKYIIGSLLSFIIDMGLFTALQFIFGKHISKSVTILVATVGARIISSLFNYFYNRNAVFESDEKVGKQWADITFCVSARWAFLTDLWICFPMCHMRQKLLHQ